MDSRNPLTKINDDDSQRQGGLHPNLLIPEQSLRDTITVVSSPEITHESPTLAEQHTGSNDSQPSGEHGPVVILSVEHIPQHLTDRESDYQEPPLDQPAADEEDEEEQDKSCCTFSSLYHLVPFANGVMEAADIGMSLYQNPSATLAEKITGPIAALACSYEFTDTSSTKNFREFLHSLKTGKRPKDWPEISPLKRKIAIGFTALSTPYGLFSDGVQAYWFFDAIRTEYDVGSSTLIVSLFQSGGVVVGIGAGTNKLFTDNYEALKTTWNLLAHKKSSYSNTFSKIMSPILGFSLGTLKTAQEEIQGYIAIKTVFGINDVITKSVIGALAAQDSIPNFCFTGLSNLSSIDEFFGYIGKGKFESKKIAAFTLSLALSVYLAFLKRTLNVIFYNDVAADFNINRPDITDTAFETISWLMFVQESIQYTSSLYPSSYVLVDRVTNGISKSASWMYNKITSCCSSPDIPRQPEESKPLLLDQDESDDRYDVETGVGIDDAIPGEETASMPREKYYHDDNPSLMFSHGRKSGHKNQQQDNGYRFCVLV
jgi:hypothetical protein